MEWINQNLATLVGAGLTLYEIIARRKPTKKNGARHMQRLGNNMLRRTVFAAVSDIVHK